jgi:hypothetical protein
MCPNLNKRRATLEKNWPKEKLEAYKINGPVGFPHHTRATKFHIA